jgi:magnesium transporter
MGELYLEEIKNLFSIKEDNDLKEEILKYHDYEVSEALLEVTKEDRLRVYKIFNYEELSNFFSYLDDEDALILFEEMKSKDITGVIQELDIDDAVDVMLALPDEEREDFLELMDEEHRNKISALFDHEEYTAGSIMTTSFIEVSVNDTVEQAMKKMIAQAVEAETINVIYITNKDRELVGVMSLREMILARKGQFIKEVMNERIVSVETSTDQEDVAEIFKDYDFASLPVVDESNKMLGIITFDDIIDVIEEEATEDYSRLAAISDVDFDTDTETVWMSAKKRLPWLLILSVLGFATSAIIAQYEGTIASVPTIALFMPMILGMAGNTGTQSLAVTVRGLNNNEFDNKSDIRKHLRREVGTGLLNGVIIGLILFIVTYMFLQLTNNPDALKITQVVSLSILASLTVATLSGALIPIIIISFKIVPAIASGPFVTMIIDILALSVYFTLATVLIINTL